jgi:hypothetical protein
MKNNFMYFRVLIKEFTILSLLLITLPVNASAASHSTYPEFAEPIGSFVISESSVTFPTEQSTDSVTITITDTAIYRYVQTSFDGHSWTTLTVPASSQCTVHPEDTTGDWLTGTCNLNITPLTPSSFNLNQSRLTATRNYITAYSCTEITVLGFRIGWDCHGSTTIPQMWQIHQFDASLEGSGHEQVIVTASSWSSPAVPENTIDGNFSPDSKWSSEGDGEWIQFTFESPVNIDTVSIAFFRGDERHAFFDIEVSDDNITWTQVYSGQSSGTTLSFEDFSFSEVTISHFRIVGHGNDMPTSEPWNSYVEVNWSISGQPGPPPPGNCSYVVDLEHPAMFKSTFESGSTVADTGTENIDNRNGGSMSVVSNPFTGDCNPSDGVLEVVAPSGSSVRAEYETQRLPTDEKTYIYTWKQFIPDDLLTGRSVSWLVLSQWKTYPCSVGGGFADYICFGGGIFNDVELNGQLLEYRFRARPDCNHIIIPVSDTSGDWYTFVEEVYWTNTSNGYYRLYRDGELIGAKSGVKTLFDNINLDGSCDIYWSSGLYTTWSGQGDMLLYLDDIAVFDTDSGVSLTEVCPSCTNNASDGCFTDCCPFSPDGDSSDWELLISSFENECEWGYGELDTSMKMEGTSSLLWDHGGSNIVDMVVTAEYFDLSEGDYMSLWVHNNILSQDDLVTIIFYSENDITSGIDYYSMPLQLNFTGWNHFVVHRNEFGYNRQPLGWDMINRVSFRSDWGSVTDPARVVHLDELKFTNNP